PDIPKILYSCMDDNTIKESKEKVKGKNVEPNEDDNEDNEKELELLLSQHFTRTRGSSRGEKSLHTTGPVQFPNEPQDLGDKLDSGLVRQPLPISSLSESLLRQPELSNTQLHSVGKNYSQTSQEKFIAVDSVNKRMLSSERFSTSEIHFPREFGSERKENETAHVADVITSRQGMSHAVFPKSESDSTPESEIQEMLFISEDDSDRHKESEERFLEDNKAIQFKESALERLDDTAKQIHEKHLQKTLLQTQSVLKNIVKTEPILEGPESQNPAYLRRELNATPLADVTITSLRSSHTNNDLVEENYKSEYKVEKGKEIKLNILEQSSEKEQASPLTTGPTHIHLKYNLDIENQPFLATFGNDKGSRLDEPNRRKEVITDVQGEKEDEETNKSVGAPGLNYRGSSSERNKEPKSTSLVVDDHQDLRITGSRDPEDMQRASKYCINRSDIVTASDRLFAHSSPINVENDPSGYLEQGAYSQSDDPANRSILEKEPCRSELNRVITNDQSSRVACDQCWSGLESQLAEKESEARESVQMKERTGGEAMWGIRDNTRCLNVTPTDELFTCQDPGRYEDSSVAECDSTGEAEAVTAAYIIKTTSESTPEKMSAGEKATVIVKLPQETALSDRPTEEKETVFDIHEGRNDGSHYPLCQCNTVGVLYDTKLEKESVSGVYNSCTLEMAQGEMMSVCGVREKLARAEYLGNESPPGEILWTSAVEGTAAPEEDLSSGTSLEASARPQQGLYHDKVAVGNIWGTCPKTESEVSSSEINIVASYCESSSIVKAPEESTGGVCIAEGGNDFMNLSVNTVAELGCDSSSTSERSPHNPKGSLEAESRELPPSSALPSREKGERSIGQFCHQSEVKQGKTFGPTILIREPTEERDEMASQSESVITEEKVLDTEGLDKHSVVYQEEISGRQSEAQGLSECLALKHIGYKILYFLLFVVFCVTMYHYDLIVCFALYLFSLYWLYCEGGRSKESVKKE
ncbi:hypothetical protein lerEdw1_007447, partial [Lerista edwardsae]